MKFDEIKELVRCISDSNIDLFEIEKEGLKLKIGKNEVKTVVREAEVVKSVPVVREEREVEIKPEVKHMKETTVSDDDLYIVKSPIVGTYYASPSPDAEAFVKVGDKVKKGDILCIVEAMKVMNEIEAEQDGEVLDILISNEDMVEYGQAIIKIK